MIRIMAQPSQSRAFPAAQLAVSDGKYCWKAYKSSSRFGQSVHTRVSSLLVRRQTDEADAPQGEHVSQVQRMTLVEPVGCSQDATVLVVYGVAGLSRSRWEFHGRSLSWRMHSQV